ncbi:NADPH-dependent F420 reductase [Acidovorax sp. JHL-9]|uniref:NADPH-dependent F420 reductase n=1 Tax=Acidovorax sp. JHL-9 TaxID=1276756 RepID=UPI0009DBB6AE
MRIGIIGAGNVGSTLACKFQTAGHKVFIANSRGPASIKEKARAIGATAVSVAEAIRGMDVVVVSIPQGSIPQLPKELFEALPLYVPVVDTGNYFPSLRDEPIAQIEAGMPESQWVEEQLGHPVIKAFNSIMAPSLADKGRPTDAPDRIALPVSGDHEEAIRKVIGLVSDAGFDGINAGSLADSWRQQPGTPAYCTNLDTRALTHALMTAVKGDAQVMEDRSDGIDTQLALSPLNDVFVGVGDASMVAKGVERIEDRCKRHQYSSDLSVVLPQ